MVCHKCVQKYRQQRGLGDIMGGVKENYGKNYPNRVVGQTPKMVGQIDKTAKPTPKRAHSSNFLYTVDKNPSFYERWTKLELWF